MCITMNSHAFGPVWPHGTKIFFICPSFYFPPLSHSFTSVFISDVSSVPYSVHRKKKVREFPVPPSRDVTTKLSLGGNNNVITEFLPRGSLVSDIPAGDRKLVDLFLQCIVPKHDCRVCLFTLSVLLHGQLYNVHMFAFSLHKLVSAVYSCLSLLSRIATLREYLYGVSADPRHTYFDKQFFSYRRSYYLSTLLVGHFWFVKEAKFEIAPVLWINKYLIRKQIRGSVNVKSDPDPGGWIRIWILPLHCCGN